LFSEYILGPVKIVHISAIVSHKEIVMNKCLSLFFTAVFLFASWAAFSPSAIEAKSLAGSYKGTAVGYHGEVNIEVELNNKGKIH
jgi:hypothetical protein